jgi:excisionase family DNA binding protein
MAGYTVAQAAAAVGRNRSTILRAIKSGKISTVRDEATGDWRINAAELHRIYPAADAQSSMPDNAASRGTDAAGDVAIELVELRERLRAADDAIRTRDDAARLRDDTIADLRRRLDRADDERARLQQQLGEALSQVRLLTDQRMAPPPAPARRWWPWGRR